MQNIGLIWRLCARIAANKKRAPINAPKDKGWQHWLE
jgi:hypothetical protein